MSFAAKIITFRQVKVAELTQNADVVLEIKGFMKLYMALPYIMILASSSSRECRRTRGIFN